MDDRAAWPPCSARWAYLAGMQHSFDVYAVATVQEETGLKGAMTSALA